MNARRSRRVLAGTLAALALLMGAMSWDAAAAAANKAPSVAITSPVAGATFVAPATITLVATASDSDGSVSRVDFYRGTTLIGSRAASPWSLAWTGVLAGSYSLTAVATDDKGATKTSTAVSITVTGPGITIAQPAAGSVVYGLVANVAGGFAGDADSTILVDGPYGSRLATISGNQYSAALQLVPGLNTLRVTVARRNGTFESASVAITANLAPLVTFTAPDPASTSFATSTPIAMTVDAMSPAGTIAKVDFLRDGIPLGTSAAPPYRFTWPSAPVGSHTLSAVATDDRGVSASAVLPIVVNGPNTAPSVVLTSPVAGARFAAPASIPLAANATDADGSVVKIDFLRDGAIVGTTNVAPFAMTLAGVPAGTYAIAARATDDRAAVTTSAAVSVTVTPPNTPPVVSLVAPADGARFTAPAAIPLAVLATDPDGTVARVDYLSGGATIATATASPFGTTLTNVAAGTYTLTARAVDNAGASALSAPVTVSVVPNAPPVISITEPRTGASYTSPADLTLSAQARDDDGSVTNVDFYVDAVRLATLSSPPYTTVWRQAPAGTHVITARAIDNAGAVGTSAPVTVAGTAVAIAITAPADGTTIAADHVHVQGTFEGPDSAGIVVNGVVAASVGNQFYAANVPLVAGANTVTATLTTVEAGVTTRSIAVTRSSVPSITLEVSPAQGIAPLTSQITVLAPDGIDIARVEIDADGDGTYEDTLIAAPWNRTISYLSPGSVNLGVRVTDTTGAVVTERVPVVLLDRAVVDARVRAVWAGMVAGLQAGDPEKALVYLDPGARERYGPVFTTLQSSLPAIVASFSNLQGLSLTEDFGEYAINRVIDGQDRLYLIYFGRNGDGIWRLGSM